MISASPRRPSSNPSFRAKSNSSRIQQAFPPGSLTSFLNTCSSLPPRTNHFFDHKKLLRPSSFILACPVRTTVFRLAGREGDSAEAEFMIGKLEAYAELEKLDLGGVR